MQGTSNVIDCNSDQHSHGDLPAPDATTTYEELLGLLELSASRYAAHAQARHAVREILSAFQLRRGDIPLELAETLSQGNPYRLRLLRPRLSSGRRARRSL